MHLPVTVKEIQAGYLMSPYFKDLYLYLAQNKFPSTKTASQKGGNISKKIYITRFSVILNDNHSRKRDSFISYTRSMHR